MLDLIRQALKPRKILNLGGFTALQVPEGIPSAHMGLTDGNQVCACLQIAC